MKNKPLALQIWITFFLVLVIFVCVLNALNIYILKNFFKEEVYKDIETTQELIIDKVKYRFNEPQNMLTDSETQEFRATQHLVFINGKVIDINSKYPKLKQNKLSDDLVEHIKMQAISQENTRERYALNDKEDEIYYVIYKRKLRNIDLVLVSYRLMDFTTTLKTSLISQLGMGMILTTVIALILSIFLARHLTKPLVELEKNVKGIAKKQWNEPIDIGRKDEIGRLGTSIESMRKQLIEHEESLHASLQYISHELKTPVMVIRSYVQSIEDGIYPKGNLIDTVGVIDKEAIRLEKKIYDLLYFTKMNYLYKQQLDKEEINIKDLIEEIVQRFSYKRKELNWILDIDSLAILGNYEQWNVAIENIVDNQIRYAKRDINIVLKEKDDRIKLSICNDGEAIQTNMLDEIFTPYKKGKKGSSGLGLAIVKRIVEIHEGVIWVDNEENGVCFNIEIPR